MSNSTFAYQTESDVIEAAHQMLASKARSGAIELSNPKDASRFFRTQIACKEVEVFSVAFLDAQHRLITCDILFQGTIDGSAVYPREVIKASLKHNACALIVAHNHPSGESEPSHADRRITDRLKKALELIDVRLIDHLVVTHDHCTSFAERGIL